MKTKTFKNGSKTLTVKKGNHPDDGLPTVTITTKVPGEGTSDMRLSYDNQQARDAAFDRYDQEFADNIFADE